MRKLKEVNVFSNGDSAELTTWSNVPYFFTETLMARGIKVNRIDLSPDPRLRNLWNKTMGRYVNRLTRMSAYDYFRSLVHYRNVKNRIRKALAEFPAADADIFMTFSFSSAGMTDKPTVLFCDWTYDHQFRYHEEKKPRFLEKLCLERENAEIEGADLVIVLFPAVAAYMKEVYKNKNIFYLGNVINAKTEVSAETALKAKEHSMDLLFVGSPRYMEGAAELVKAFRLLKKEYPDLKLHIIGIESWEFKDLPEGVNCYGYLNKADPEQRRLFYDLFTRARMFINTTPKWGAFSAGLEALYFYIPVIVTPYDEFVSTFGEDISFGTYCRENEAEKIAESVRYILDHPTYTRLCQNAHEAVKDYTWSAYIDKVVAKIEALPEGADAR